MQITKNLFVVILMLTAFTQYTSLLLASEPPAASASASKPAKLARSLSTSDLVSAPGKRKSIDRTYLRKKFDEYLELANLQHALSTLKVTGKKQSEDNQKNKDTTDDSMPS